MLSAGVQYPSAHSSRKPRDQDPIRARARQHLEKSPDTPGRVSPLGSEAINDIEEPHNLFRGLSLDHVGDSPAPDTAA